MDKKDILPGETWTYSIQKAIQRSDFFLACLSANSIKDRGWVQREIKQALDVLQGMSDRDIYLIPVRLEDCRVPERLRDIIWVDLFGEFEETGWTELVEAIQASTDRREMLAEEGPSSGTEMLTPEKGPEQVLEFEPYVGPRPFERDDQAIFLGRDHEASDLFSLVIAHRVLLLYAQSGAGKTSLINAGLIPLLEEEGFEVLPLARVQGLIPEDIEPEEISNPYVFNTLMSWAEDEADARRPAQMSFASFLKQREHPLDEEELPSPRVIIFDRFEELFTSYPERWQDRKGFFEQVGDALEGDPLLRVVFVMREDYIAQLDPYAPLLPEKLRTRFRLERLREGAALLAVTGPLRDTGRSFAEGVAEQLVEELLKVRATTGAGETVEVTGEFVEPVQLQVVCQSLWRDLPPDVVVITQEDLRDFGDVNQALSGFYERSIKRAAQEAGARERALRAWFEDVLITPAGTRGTVFRGREETGGIPNAAVDVLESLHFIRGEWRAGAPWYGLTHDRFIEPIRTSNETWRIVRREKWMRIGGYASVILVLMLVLRTAISAILPTEATQENRQLQATTTALAAEVSDAQATIVAALSEAGEALAELSKAGYVHQGLIYAEQGDYDQAIAHYDQGIELYSDYAEAYVYRGLAYANLGEYDQAIADYNKAIELDPDYAKAYNNRGHAYADQEKYEHAIADYNKAIELNHDPLSWPYNNRGAAYTAQGKYEQAITDYNKAIELDPNYAKPYNNRGFAYRKLGNYEQAIADYNKAIELDPNYARAYNNRGVAYYGLGDYEQAIADFTKAIQLNHDPLSWPYNNRGVAYKDQGKYEQAIADCTKAIELDPNYAEAYNNRGFAYRELGNYEQAIADYNKAIELDPDYAEAYNNRGIDSDNLGDYEQAIADYNKAIELNHDPLSWPYNNRGAVYTHQGNYEQAIADYNKAIELDPNYAGAYNNRGFVYLKLGNYEQAIADYNKAIELDPNYARAYNNRGYAYYRLGDYEQAISDYTKAIGFDPDYVLAYQNRGLAYADQGKYDLAISDYTRAGNVYHELGDYGQAIANYTKAIELDPNYAPAYDNRGLVYADQGKYDLAISDFTKAIELKPDYAEVYYYRGKAYSQLHDYTHAFQDFEKSIELNPNNPWVYYYRGLIYANLGNKENATTDLEIALQLTEPALDEDARSNARATLERLLPCQLTLLNPHDGATFGPETSEVILEWQFNRSLATEEYFFVDVTYPHDDQIWHDGTWKDTAHQIPSGTQETNWILRDYLCQPGFANTGEYSWSVAIKRKTGIAPSIDDEIVCTSSTWSFKWAGCPTPRPPTPTPTPRSPTPTPTPPYP